ncbi:LLM class F420-dependent oxidoreductase [Phytohabitans sp. ZYX-F-186]|uniref:LLM class F420-dependent oxidoreductase n=1 Tax=Phytohabitans maris TaxID=3071409 RepID=A0ABU0ZCK8_9ACTN|nr:LLM class F420-dependent oxidoreductase [Phytohabitans sp. ZYX-F-186]MDQ7904055.1 LLM class F420-dependent oxidoreductase [Phytohabitans sp. ZYX-F-186]
MDLGIHFLNFTNPGGDAAIAPLLADTAKAADDGGFALFTVMDHFFQMEQVWPAENPMLEGYSALAYAAAHTSRVELATLVTGVTYRHPGLLAKTVTTLDVLSGGRAVLGLGAAWYEREHRGLGVPFPPLAERFERLEETLRICLQMWSDDDGAYAGRHYTLAETLNRPRSLQRPRPPILIGGNGEQKTLRLVAKYADACNFTVNEPDVVRHKVGVLRRHCEREGRDIGDIRITVQNSVDPTQDPDAFLRRAEELAALGVRHLHMRAPQPDPAGFVARVVESVKPAMDQIEPAKL